MERLFTLTAADLMHRPVHTIRDDQSVHEAAAMLIEHGIQGAPVVNRFGKVVGVLSATDITRYERDRHPDVVRESDYYRLAETGRGKDVEWDKGFHIEGAEATKVRELMTPKVYSVAQDAHIGTVLGTLVDNHIHRVVVLAQGNGKLQGVISATDIMRALLSEWIRRC